MSKEHDKKRSEYKKRKEAAEYLLVPTPANEQWRDENLLEGVCIYYIESLWSPKICEEPVTPGSPLCKKHTEENNAIALQRRAEKSFIVIDGHEYKPADLPPLNADTMSEDRSFKENTPGGKMKRGWKLAYILTPSISFPIGLVIRLNEAVHDSGYHNFKLRGGSTYDTWRIVLTGLEWAFVYAGIATIILTIVFVCCRPRKAQERGNE